MSIITRERSDTENISSVERATFIWNETQNPKPTPTYSQVGSNGTWKFMRDRVVPGFEVKSARGELYNNPMYRSRETRQISSTGGTFYKTVNGKKYWVEQLGYAHVLALPSSGLIPSLFPSAPPMPISALQSMAATQALSRVKPVEYEGLVALAELRETLGYLRNPFKTGMKLAGSLEKRVAPIRSRYIRNNMEKMSELRSRQHANIVKNLEDLYLEFRYGVRPLIKDVEDLLLAVQAEHKVPERQTFRSDKFTDEYSDSLFRRETGTYSSQDVYYTYDRSVEVRVGLLYEYTRDPFSSEYFGFGIDRLPIAVWEATPLSFISDWFFNLGEFIAAVTPSAGMSRRCAWTTTIIKHTLTQSVSNASYTGYPTRTIDSSGTNTYEFESYNRSPTISTPSIGLNPDWRGVFSDPWRLADMASIIHQRIRSADYASGFK
jgi:hypothetical protein